MLHHMKKIFGLFCMCTFCFYAPVFAAEDHLTSEISLSLTEALNLAVNQNLDIKLASFDQEYMHADLDRAQAIFDTMLTAQLDYEKDERAVASTLAGTESLSNNYDIGISRKFGTGTTLALDLSNERNWTNSQFASINPAHDSELAFTVTQSVGKNFFGLIDRGEVRATLLDIEKQDLATLNDIESSLATVETFYWQLAFAQEIIGLRQEMFKRAQELFDIYQDKLERGTAEEADVYASEANATSRRIDLDIAKNNLANAGNMLNVALNMLPTNTIRAEDDLVLEPAGVDLIASIKTALNTRRDYVRAKKDVEAKDIRLAMKRNNRWPEIDLVASYARNGIDRKTGDALSNVFDEENPDYYVGLSFEFPFENRQARSEHKKALIDKKRAITNLKKLENEIISELDEKARSVNLNKENVVKWQKIADLQEKKLAEEEKRFGYGRSNSDTLIRFQDDALNAKVALYQAYLEYRQSLVQFELAQNTILKKVGLE